MDRLRRLLRGYCSRYGWRTPEINDLLSNLWVMSAFLMFMSNVLGYEMGWKGNGNGTIGAG